MGLFSLRPIKRGEELTIDYKLQRYGKIAQKCFCETPSCRGYIGSSEASDIYIDGSKRNKNDDNNVNNNNSKRENSQDSTDDGKDPKDGFRIPRLVGPKRPSESSDGHLNDSSNNNISNYNNSKDNINGSNNISRKNYSDLSTTASLLLPVKKYRGDQQQQQQQQQQIQPVDPNQAEQMKLSKEAFRMQFELNELKRQKEEEKLNYLRQIEYMKQEIARTRSLGGYIDAQSPYFAPPMYDEPLISWDSHFSHPPPDDQNSALHPALGHFGQENYSFDDQVEYDSYYQLEASVSLPLLTNYNINQNVLIELTSKEHTLLPDEKAVIHTDYGIEYVPMVKKRKASISKSLFDPSFPPPGTYYECVIENSVYYVPYSFDSQNYPLDFFATTAQASWPDFDFLHQPVQGPLARYWRRACDPKTNRFYYYNIRTGYVSWHMPDGSGMKRKLPFNSEPIGGLAHKIESIIASADSTSTPPPSLANASSMVTTASQSPPGIFAISNGIEKDSKKSQQAEPDQSMPKKSKQMVFDGRTKKGLEKFKEEITELVKKALNPYRKPDCKVGRIDTNEDFKFLARKVRIIYLFHFVSLY